MIVNHDHTLALKSNLQQLSLHYMQYILCKCINFSKQKSHLTRDEVIAEIKSDFADMINDARLTGQALNDRASHTAYNSEFLHRDNLMIVYGLCVSVCVATEHSH